MRALFPRWTNTAARLSLVILATLPAVGIGALLVYARTPYGTFQDHPVEQPLQFDHRHHVADVGIDCRYCHTSVETSSSAGIPPVSTCMNCHAQIWNKSPILEEVRERYFAGEPIEWVRVHKVPDFVYFSHEIHVNKGVGCVTCHGRVDQMATMSQDAPLTMQWCLDCHRDPEPNLRPLDQITSMTWTPDGADAASGAELAEQLDVHTRTSCTTCHR